MSKESEVAMARRSITLNCSLPLRHLESIPEISFYAPEKLMTAPPAEREQVRRWHVFMPTTSLYPVKHGCRKAFWVPCLRAGSRFATARLFHPLPAPHL